MFVGAVSGFKREWRRLIVCQSVGDLLYDLCMWMWTDEGYMWPWTDEGYDLCMWTWTNEGI